MNLIDREFHRSAMEKAVQMPDVGAGERLIPTKYEVRARKKARWALFTNGSYTMSTGEKTEEGANRWLMVFLLQKEAELDGIYDVRRASVAAIIKHREEAVDKKELVSAPVIKSTLKALKDYVKGRQLRELTDDWVEETQEAMMAAGYAYEYSCNGIRYLCTAIRKYTKPKYGAIYMPFNLPPSAPGRVRVLEDFEDAIVQRWSTGTESYDPQTGVWTPASEPLSDTELRDRRLVYRQVYLGKRFGSRSAIYENLSHGPNTVGGGYFDLDEGIFYRVPPGTRTARNKLAPPVNLPPEVVEELRRWEEEDRGKPGWPWVFPTLDGEPLGYDWQAIIYKRSLEALGIMGVTGHTLRHTCITLLVKARVEPKAISALCGVSLQMLHKRYDHSDNFALQEWAHAAIVRMDIVKKDVVKAA
jgi:hypothetical protein